MPLLSRVRCRGIPQCMFPSPVTTSVWAAPTTAQPMSVAGRSLFDRRCGKSYHRALGVKIHPLFYRESQGPDSGTAAWVPGAQRQVTSSSQNKTNSTDLRLSVSRGEVFWESAVCPRADQRAFRQTLLHPQRLRFRPLVPGQNVLLKAL